jgi:hypothetical protein
MSRVKFLATDETRIEHGSFVREIPERGLQPASTLANQLISVRYLAIGN